MWMLICSVNWRGQFVTLFSETSWEILLVLSKTDAFWFGTRHINEKLPAFSVYMTVECYMNPNSLNVPHYFLEYLHGLCNVQSPVMKISVWKTPVYLVSHAWNWKSWSTLNAQGYGNQNEARVQHRLVPFKLWCCHGSYNGPQETRQWLYYNRKTLWIYKGFI